MNRTRDYRRGCAERAKRRVARHIFWRFNRWGHGYLASDPHYVGREARTRHPCSCAMCGNPRRHFRGLTRQERRADG